MFANNTEKKILIAIMFIMAPLSVIYLFLTKPILAIIVLVFTITCFLLFLASDIIANKVLKVGDAQQDMEVSAEDAKRMKAELEVDSTSNNEGLVTEVSAEKKEKTQAELEEESKNKQATNYMENGLPDSMNAHGDEILIEVQDVENKCPVNYTQTMVAPYKISLDSEAQGTDDDIKAVEAPQDKSYWAGRMQSLPVNMNGFYQSIPLDQPLSDTDGMVQESVEITTKSNNREDDTATRRVSSTISFCGIDQQHQAPYVQNYMSLMQSPSEHMNAFGGPISSSHIRT